jgi:speckle-type POZ protein
MSSSEPAFTTSAIVANTESASHMVKIDGYSRTKGLATGVHLKSCSFIVGGHSWSLAYLPNGDCAERSEYISMYLVLNGVAPGTGGGPVLAQFSISLLDRAGKPAPTYTRTGTTTPYVGPGAHWGFPGFIRREALEKSRHLNVKEDSFSVRCDLTVVTEFRAEDAASIAAEAASAPLSVPVPPPDMWRHLEQLLLSQMGADVRFRVDGEDFAAHRCVLAARSPVFQAELFGTMKEASSEAQCVVEIHDMRADVFRNLLYFMYTDALPLPVPDQEPRPDPEEEALMAQHLLVAADRYGMERLKFICEDALCRHIDVSTVATTMALAEQHHCQGLKEACFQFLRTPGALNTVMATDDFDHLATSCPSLIKELISKLAAR